MRTPSRLLITNNNVHGYVGDFTAVAPNKAIILSGGGIDSFMSTMMYLEALKLYDEDDELNGEVRLIFMCVNYGQQSFPTELAMTDAQAAFFQTVYKLPNRKINTEVVIITDNLMELIRNPLSNRDEQKQATDVEQKAYKENDDYVPNRNARFVFTAAGYAESVKGVDTIIIGAVGNVNQDNSLAFLEAAHATIMQSNRDCFPGLYAPFVLMSKSMVAWAAAELFPIDKYTPVRIDNLTTSCFDASEICNDYGMSVVIQCGECRSCSSLKQAFKFANVTDPYTYKGSRPKSAKSKFKLNAKRGKTEAI